MTRLLAIDPGKEKCGYALLSGPGELLDHGIIPTKEFESQFAASLSEWNPELILLGNGTYSKKIELSLSPLLRGVPYKIVDEHDSTYRARKLYFQHHPPRGIWRFIPLGLQVPPVPYDDYAAMLLGLRYLETRDRAS